MLDVHPPHQAAHTWKDFFIHIATIVVGLFIAIGLEQTVEAIHHHHEREALLDDMREEARKNVRVCQYTIRLFKQEISISDDWAAVLRTAPVTAGTISVIVPAGLRERERDAFSAPGGSQFLPTIPVWTRAKETQTVALLRPETARNFDELLYTLGWIESDARAYLDATWRYQASLRVPNGAGSGSYAELPLPEMLMMTPDQRDDIVKAAAIQRQVVPELIHELSVFSSLSQAIAEGAESDEDYQNWLRQHAQ